MQLLLLPQLRAIQYYHYNQLGFIMYKLCKYILQWNPSIRTPDISLNQDTMHGPSYIDRYMYRTTPETRTPPLIRTFWAGPRVSGIEEFHCTMLLFQGLKYPVHAVYFLLDNCLSYQISAGRRLLQLGRGDVIWIHWRRTPTPLGPQLHVVAKLGLLLVTPMQ
jgi:hypothetical protein